jgi:flagellar biosynthesis protein
MATRRIKITEESQKKAGNRPTAVALAYHPGVDNAPKVVASGSGRVAEQIVALAHEHDIPLYDDPALAAALSTVDLGQEIPQELYMVVAQVLRYIYRVIETRKIK